MLALTLAAAVWDWRRRRIPNALLLPVFLTALALNWARGLAGMALAALIFLPLWLVRAVGAGDVKLMATAGALIGPMAWLKVFALTAVLNGVWALAILAVRGREALGTRKPFAPALLGGVLVWLWWRFSSTIRE